MGRKIVAFFDKWWIAIAGGLFVFMLIYGKLFGYPIRSTASFVVFMVSWILCELIVFIFGTRNILVLFAKEREEIRRLRQQEEEDRMRKIMREEISRASGEIKDSIEHKNDIE